MGLKSVFGRAAVAALQAGGDVITESQYYHITSTVYDASTGLASAVAEQYTISGLFTKFSADSIDNENVLPSDVKFIVAQNDFTPGKPIQYDYVRRVEAEASVQYNVQGFDQDPAGALWIIQLRKS